LAVVFLRQERKVKVGEARATFKGREAAVKAYLYFLNVSKKMLRPIPPTEINIIRSIGKLHATFDSLLIRR